MTKQFLPKVAEDAILLASVNRLSDSEEYIMVDRNTVLPLTQGWVFPVQNLFFLSKMG